MEKHELDSKIAEVSKSILSYCMARTSNQHDAEDLAQDILLELMRSAPNIRDDKAFYGFMWSVAGHVYKQWYKKKLRRRECEWTEDIGDASNCFDDIWKDNSDLFLLRRELALLSEKYRHATILYYLENKSCSEISSLLSVSESMVKYLLFKSRKILKGGMSMERDFGEQSYRPKHLNLMYMGEGPNRYWELMDQNKIRQNILWACYNDSLTEEEIALQIGVSLPYIENDIQKLTDVWLLKKDGRRYRTNIILFTSDFETEKSAKCLPFQKEIAEKLRAFLDENGAEIRGIGFYGSQMSLSSLKWHMVTMMLLDAYSAVGDRLLSHSERPATAFGEHAYLWGVEQVKGGFNCCTLLAEEWHTNISMYFMDWSGRTNLHHSDFYSSSQWVKLYGKICCGNMDDLNEFEGEIAAEMVRKGYVVRRDNTLFPAMPVYTEEQLNGMMKLQKTVADEIVDIMQKLYGLVAELLGNHVPTHLKSQVNEIAAMSLFHDATYVPASLLVHDGYLSTDWVPGEIATSYAVIQ